MTEHAPGGDRRRVLVVDDDPEIRATHARVLQRFGHEAETAADGIEALSMLPLDFDLVVCDAEMPNMDGFEVMAPGEVEVIRHAAPMHDVGKLGVPDRILLKPGKLDDDEWGVMRAHTTMGGSHER